jgi:hypothetical protein
MPAQSRAEMQLDLMRGDLPKRLIRWVAACVLTAACSAVAAHADDVKFPVGSSIGLIPPPGLELSGTAPGFQDTENKVSMLLLELPLAAYLQVEASMSTEAAKKRGIVVDHRETLFTDAGTAVLSAGDDANDKSRKWMMVALLPKVTALVSVQIPEAARKLYPDEAIRKALGSLTVRPTPIAEQLSLVPYKLDELAGFRAVAVLNRSTVVLTEGPKDDLHAIEQPHIVVGIAPSVPGKTDDRARLAQLAFNNLPGFIDRRVTVSEMLRLDGQQVYEIRADALDFKTKTPVSVVQWVRFGRNAYLHIVAVTARDNWRRDFPKFRAVRDGIQPRR